jgi:uncharacterized coiled-coil protein SlyX
LETIVATNAELQAEVDRLNAQLEATQDELAEARAAAPPADSQPAERPRLVLPSFGLSEGTRLDLLEAQVAVQSHPRLTEIVITEPFAGHRIRVTADGPVREDLEQIGDALDDTLDNADEPPVADR